MKIGGYEIKPGANLRYANLHEANLRKANLHGANLHGANLREADLRGADLRWADLIMASLREASLHGANLQGTDLQDANLQGADLRWADLRGASLREADLRGADISRCKGLIKPSSWLKENFRQTKRGYVVFKDVESDFFSKPKHWVIKKGACIEEVCNENRTNDCGCGVSFGTLDWLKKNSNNEIWECLIEWRYMADVCVPYNTEGKARCWKLKLLKPLEGGLK
jgi:hypothetical protein